MSILTSGHDVADARLHREVSALQASGLTVEVLGLGDSRDAPREARTRTWRRRGHVSRAVLAVSLPWRARASTVITLDPDSALAASLVRHLPGAPVRALVCDVHEDYPALLADRAWAKGPAGAVARLLARVAAKVPKMADLTVVADEHLLADAPRRIVLRNLADPTFLPSPAPPEDRPRAVYVGDVRASRGLTTMLDALSSAPAWTLDLVGPLDRESRGLIDALPAETAARVRVHGRLPPHAAWRVAKGAWVGLLLLQDTPAFRAAVPSKLYEYVACGLAVVATPLPRVRALLESWGAGVTVDDAADVAKYLERWGRSGSADVPADLRRHWAAARARRDQHLDRPADLVSFAESVRDVVRSSQDPRSVQGYTRRQP